MGMKWHDTIRAILSFTRVERRRILYLLPLLVVVSLLVAALGRPHFERSFTMLADARIDSADRSGTSRAETDNFFRRPTKDANAIGKQGDRTTNNRRSEIAGDADLFVFDPNTVSRDELVALGFSPRQAQVIINYRTAGKRFYEAEDFADCYTVSDEMFEKLAPYIRIEPLPEFSTEKERSAENMERGNDTMSSQKEVSSQPVEVENENHEMRNREHEFDSATHAEYFPGQSQRRSSLRKVELNGADQTTLDSVRGIGALTAGRIVAYRERLGGFANVAQLQEVEGMTERNFELICPQIWVDSAKIQKIDINFAPPEELLRHPYLTAQSVRKILKNRQLKGGWRTLRDMIDDHTISQQQASKLAPYLCFGPVDVR